MSPPAGVAMQLPQAPIGLNATGFPAKSVMPLHGGAMPPPPLVFGAAVRQDTGGFPPVGLATNQAHQLCVVELQMPMVIRLS